MSLLGAILLLLGLLGIGSFFLYPFFLRLLPKRHPTPAAVQAGHEPPAMRLSVLLAVRNGRSLIEAKINNLRQLSPYGVSEWLIYSDGSTDGTSEYLTGLTDPELKTTILPSQHGKAWCLTDMLPKASGEVLLFTDADALIDPAAIPLMLHHFADPTVGGVCGQRVIHQQPRPQTNQTAYHQVENKPQQPISPDTLTTAVPQSAYIDLDSKIKRLESRSISLTSNDGKLYLMRRSLAVPIPGPVTDDLWQALAIVDQGFRLTFEPEAKVFIPSPARSLSHEFERRRRIVSTSLNGIFAQKHLLNPARTGWFAICLLINKVNRRLIPLWLLSFVIGGLALAPSAKAALSLTALLLSGVLLLIAYHKGHWQTKIPTRIAKLVDKITYFGVGLLGMAIGVTDYLSGTTPDRWEPKKQSP